MVIELGFEDLPAECHADSAAAWPMHPRRELGSSAVVVRGASGVQRGEGLGHEQLA